MPVLEKKCLPGTDLTSPKKSEAGAKTSKFVTEIYEGKVQLHLRHNLTKRTCGEPSAGEGNHFPLKKARRRGVF